MIRKEDFEFERRDDNPLTYWFKITGETKETLTHRYMEQSMIEVTEVAIDMTDGQWGIKRMFPFNYDVIMPYDNELETVLRAVAFEQHAKNINN